MHYFQLRCRRREFGPHFGPISLIIGDAEFLPHNRASKEANDNQLCPCGGMQTLNSLGLEKTSSDSVAFDVLGLCLHQAWRVLRFNNSTRQGVQRVTITASQAGPHDIWAHPDCMAFEYLKIMAAAGVFTGLVHCSSFPNWHQL